MRRVVGNLPLVVFAAAGAAAAATGGEEPLSLQQAPGQGAAQQGQKALPAEELRDIQGPVPLAGQLPSWAIGGGLALIAAILAGIYLYRKRRRKPAQAAAPTPWEAALAELAAAKKLQGQGLLYMERVSEILRRYIESRFAIRSTRQTTREFLAGLGHAGEHSPLHPYRPELQACLEQADMAKFARLVPEPGNAAQMERAVTQFVKKTEPQAGSGDKP